MASQPAMAQTRRLFVSAPPAVDPGGAPLPLDAEEAHYATRVLRLGDNDAVVALDGQGHEAPATLRVAGRRDVPQLALNGPWASGTALRAPWELTLLLPLPKGERADWMVEKLAELGCHALVFVHSTYSQGGGAGGSKRLERLARVARAAARQARHGRPPQLSAEEVPLGQALAARPPGPGYVAHPVGDAPTLVRALLDGRQARAADRAGDAAPRVHHTLLLGPEGGLSPEEVAEAQAAGLCPVGLGPHVLRLETAAIVAAGSLVQLLGEVKEPVAR